MIAITGNKDSTLAKNCDIVQILPKFEEAGYLKLAPTSSTTIELVYLDSIAVAISKHKDFQKKNFGLFHPAGSLGKKLLTTTQDLMAKGDENPVMQKGATIRDAINILCKKPLGLVNIVDENNNLLGVISDGDLRRAISKDIDIKTTLVEDIMTKKPVVCHIDELAVDVLSLMTNKNVSVIPVLDKEDKVSGTLLYKDIIKEGIYLW